MKSSRGGKTFGSGSLWSLGLPLVFFLCLVFFLAGFFGFALFSQQDEWSARPRLLEEESFDPLPHGKSGKASFNSIPFQEFSNEMRWDRLPFWRVLKVLSWRPRALYFPNFASAEQCQTIVKIAGSELKPSTLALREGETAENTQGIRTSSGMFISASEDKTGVLDSIEEKIARVTMIPRSHGEAFNILRYEIGQAYHSHYDAFNPAEYGPQKSQRVASFLLYLSDVQEGGETMFPFENGTDFDTTTYDFRKCIGLKVKPRRGDGLLFYSLFPNGTIDPTSIHGSCPVIRGEKWVATKWIRDNVQFD